MAINEKAILERANELYAERKLAKMHRDIAYVAPECRPAIESEQVKCLLTALVEALNK